MVASAVEAGQHGRERLCRGRRGARGRRSEGRRAASPLLNPRLIAPDVLTRIPEPAERSRRNTTARPPPGAACPQNTEDPYALPTALALAETLVLHPVGLVDDLFWPGATREDATLEFSFDGAVLRYRKQAVCPPSWDPA